MKTNFKQKVEDSESSTKMNEALINSPQVENFLTLITQLLPRNGNPESSALKMTNYVDNLRYFVKKKVLSKDKGIFLMNGYSISSHEAELDELIGEYIIEHFTLWELYIIFLKNQPVFGLEKPIIKDARQYAVDCINNQEILTIQQKKRLKRKVWDMDPILFGLILDFVQLSDLLYDVENVELEYPPFSLSN